MARIPKTIHYCWFGGNPFSALIDKCIASWKSNMPDYEIVQWNESNFDINSNKYVKQAHEAKKYAFVSDYVRLYALYHHGGIYLDTDVEILKSLDSFSSDGSFMGFEVNECVATAIIGSCKGNEFIAEFLNSYQDKSFISNDGSVDLTANVTINTDMCKKQGLLLNGKKQKMADFVVYPQSYFCPNDVQILFSKTPRHSFAIHHYEGSWLSTKPNKSSFIYRLEHFIGGKLRNFIGQDRYVIFNKFVRRLLKA